MTANANHELLYQPQAELALIATVLVEPRAWALVDHVPAAAFADPLRQELWRYLDDHQGKVSLDSLVTYLAGKTGRQGSLLGELGGREALERLTLLAKPLAAAEDLAFVVNECSANRQYHRALQSALGLLEPAAEVLSAQERIDRAIDDLRGIRVGVSLDVGELLQGALDWHRDFQFRLDNPGKLTGLKLGWRDVDGLLLGGLEGGNFVVFASSPGEGKSILVGEAALRLVLRPQDDGRPRKVAFFGVEMSGKEMYGRWLSSHSKLDADRLRRATLTKDELAKLKETEEVLRGQVVPNLFYLGPGKFASIDDIVRQAKYLVKEHGAAAIFVDYLQRVRTTAKYGERNDLGIAEITSKLKQLAADLAVPVIAVSQITREAIRERHGRPRLVDLAEGSGVERDADYVVGVWRPARHIETELVAKTWHNVAVVELLKGRFRQQSTIYLAFNGNCSRFDDLDLATIRTLAGDAAQKALRPAAEPKRH